MGNQKLIFRASNVLFYAFITMLITACMHETPDAFSDMPASGDVTILTDNTEYSRQDIVYITVENSGDTSILYSDSGDRFWELEYFKDNEWINTAYEEGGGFQLTTSEIGEPCIIALYEQAEPIELPAGSSISSTWNQKICAYGTEGPQASRNAEFLPVGEYRLVFYYGKERNPDNPFQLAMTYSSYSNSFVIS